MAEEILITGDMTLDDIGDVPSFDKWPTGAYPVTLADGIEERIINDKKFYVAKLTLTAEPPEYSLQGDQTKPVVGATNDLMFDPTNKYAMAEYKKLAMPIASATGAKTITEINENSRGLQMLVLLKCVKNKKRSEETGNDVYNHRITMATMM